MSIRSIGSHSVFELRLGKRGGRLGWKDAQGLPQYAKFIAHAKESDLIYWREPDPGEIFDETASKSLKSGTDWKAATDRAIEIAAESARTRDVFREACIHQIPEIKNAEAYKRYIAGAISAACDAGRLEECKTHDGTKSVYLIGPKGGAVGKLRDEIQVARETKKQGEFKTE